MTRLAVLADIHGNQPALDAVIADMQNYQVDHVVVAGDVINWGPFSRQVLETVYENRWAVIRGNNELYLLDYETPRAPDYWSSFTLPPIIHEQLGEHWVNVVASLPDSLSLRFRDAPPIYVCHGIPNNPWQSISPLTSVDDIRTGLQGVSETTVICAHSHIPMIRKVDQWTIINSGSVGVPLDGQFTASYMILDGDRTGWSLAEYRRIPFDYAPLYAEFERQNFVERNGIPEQLVIAEFKTARLQLYPFVIWQRKTYPSQSLTYAMLDEFLQLDDIRAYIPLEYRDLDGSLYRDDI